MCFEHNTDLDEKIKKHALVLQNISVVKQTCSVSNVQRRAIFVKEASLSLSRCGVSAMQQAAASVSARRLRSTGS